MRSKSWLNANTRTIWNFCSGSRRFLIAVAAWSARAPLRRGDPRSLCRSAGKIETIRCLSPAPALKIYISIMTAKTIPQLVLRSSSATILTKTNLLSAFQVSKTAKPCSILPTHRNKTTKTMILALGLRSTEILLKNSDNFT